VKSRNRQSLLLAFVDYLNHDRMNWTLVLLVPAGVILWWLIPRLVDSDRIGLFWNTTEYIIALLTLLAVLLSWFAHVLKQIELEREIDILICFENEPPITLPYRPLRYQLDRSELLGIMGVYHGEHRFPPQFLRPVLEALDGGESPLVGVIRGKSDELRIEVNRPIYDLIKDSLSSTKPLR